ncbi:(2Fe-2S) ferredoxin domain-containing protein [Gloeocapsopsis sp. IPPAS B-1203]|uniref:(2Fe-2S) ferredoxin domain-containing protein n=1 Tax=Gloeocapsopsis sp. IPPAS B-1203 TaxID=2049454 RepID=UPI000C18F914|nr:(2Fe-2S) ferredoxin domain-containing protein [Gloeocapsopsis sp. IPPAS B-1203]PIG92901.1 ferredoxin [Gloeocapsopsis sp. IPPAS B-1203]
MSNTFFNRRSHSQQDNLSRCVMVCQHRTCRKQGAAKVLAAFQSHPVAGIDIVSSNCLGQCGNGPMVLVLPEQIWYSRVQPAEVPAVVKRHLLGGCPVAAMLYSPR